MDIIPSILVKTKKEFDEKIKEASGLAGWVHLDIADGIFVPNSTIDGIAEVNGADTELNIGVHLMVQKPENHIGRWMETTVSRIIVHAEATTKLKEIISEVKDADIQIGVALNPETPIDKIKEFVDGIDLVHFMTVSPGFYGGKFMPEVVEKIKDFHYFYPDVPIGVDGSINPETIGGLVEAGASMFVVGTYFWDSPDKKEAVEKLMSVIGG